jgi:hypothetical protein
MDALGKLGEYLPPISDIVFSDFPTGMLTGAADEMDGGI